MSNSAQTYSAREIIQSENMPVSTMLTRIFTRYSALVSMRYFSCSGIASSSLACETHFCFRISGSHGSEQGMAKEHFLITNNDHFYHKNFVNAKNCRIWEPKNPFAHIPVQLRSVVITAMLVDDIVYCKRHCCSRLWILHVLSPVTSMLSTMNVFCGTMSFQDFNIVCAWKE